MLSRSISISALPLPQSLQSFLTGDSPSPRHPHSPAQPPCPKLDTALQGLRKGQDQLLALSVQFLCFLEHLRFAPGTF